LKVARRKDIKENVSVATKEGVGLGD